MSDGSSRRLFVAIFPPAPALEHLGRAVDELAISKRDGAAARLTARDGWHVTLAFLGSTPADRIADITAALARAATAPYGHAASDVAASDVAGGGVAGGGVAGVGVAGVGVAGGGGPGGAGAPGIQLRIAGSGTFGGNDRQILWVGLDGNVGALRRLAEVTGRELTELGLPPRGRDFQPHLTISRPGADIPADLIAADARHLATYSGPLWTIATLDLVASDPAATHAVPRYSTLVSAPLPPFSPI